MSLSVLSTQWWELSPCTDPLSLPPFSAQVSVTLPLLLPNLSEMDKLLDMNEFGEAAPYLRKSYTEQLKLQTVPFDGKSQPQAAQHSPECVPEPAPLPRLPQESSLPLRTSQALHNSPSTPQGKKISLVRKAGFDFPLFC